MSENVRLVVMDPTMKKRGGPEGKPWELWSFKAVTPDDGKTHTINTFWKNIDQYTGKEVIGIVTSEEKTLKDGTPYTSRLFRPDQKWEHEQAAPAGEAPSPAPASQTKPAPLKTGTQVLREQIKQPIPTRVDVIPWAAEKAHELVKCLVMKDIAKDADTICTFFDVIAGKYTDSKLALYCHPEIFAPNPIPQEKSATPARLVEKAKAMMEDELGAEEVDE